MENRFSKKVTDNMEYEGGEPMKKPLFYKSGAV
jgi:hypothetical protein